MASRKLEKTARGGTGAAAAGPLTFQAFEASVSDAWDICDVDIGGHQSQAAAAAGVIDLQPGGRGSNKKTTPPKPAKSENTVSAKKPQLVSSPVKTANIQSVPTSTSITTTTSPLPPSSVTSSANGQSVTSSVQTSTKQTKLELLLACPTFELEELRRLSWPGISPAHVRAKAWKTLCGYYPPQTQAGSGRPLEVVARKRDEYNRYVKQYFTTKDDDVHGDTYRQIHIDIPRMSPVVALFQQRPVQEIFERILYIWAIRHPASGYVQAWGLLFLNTHNIFLTMANRV